MEQFSRLSGWANFPQIDCRTLEFQERSQRSMVSENSLIARGNGRSLGDSAINPNATLLMRGQSQAMWVSENLIRCESGVLMKDILSMVVPQGKFPIVTPGTKFATVGGMIAADVHGKNHHRVGSFCENVDEIEMLLANGERIKCSQNDNSDLFWATCGGMGLTGIILSAKIRLMNIESSWIKQQALRFESIEEAFSAFEDSDQFEYVAAWLDAISLIEAGGRGLVFRGDHALQEELPQSERKSPLQMKVDSRLKVPALLPQMLLNKSTIKIFNELYLRRRNRHLVSYDSFLYPLDSVLDWNRIYGKRGFAQHQCVIPTSAALAGFKDLFKTIKSSSLRPYLGILKKMGKANDGLISFPIEGYTLVLDFPGSKGLSSLFHELNSIVNNYGGRVYLAKDNYLSAEQFERSYFARQELQNIRTKYGAINHFCSLQSKRIGLDI